MPDIHSSDSWQLLIAILWPYIQETIKRSALPIFAWLGKETPKANMVLSAAVALLTTFGIHFHWTTSPDGGGALLMTIPPLAALEHVAAQWVTQHIAYKTTISGPAMQEETLKELKAINQTLASQKAA